MEFATGSQRSFVAIVVESARPEGAALRRKSLSTGQSEHYDAREWGSQSQARSCVSIGREARRCARKF